MVKMSFSYIEKIEDMEIRLEHIKAIKDVCEKKIFLEVAFSDDLVKFKGRIRAVCIITGEAQRNRGQC